jgi:DNA-3-methyladenine glycosylase II
MNINLKPVPPYNFNLSASIFSGGDNQIRQYQDGIFHQAVRVDDQLILVKVKSRGTVDEPELEIKLESASKVELATQHRAVEILSSILNLQLDLRPFYKISRKDRVLGVITEELKGLKSPLTPTVFEALVDSVIEQQISLAVARIMQNRLIKTFGDALEIDQETYYVYPTPKKLASISIDGLKSVGLSSRKAEYILGISKLISEGQLDLEKFKQYEDTSRIIEEMDQIHGVGVWTSEMTIIRGMGRLEVIPADDLGLKKIISHFYFRDRKILSKDARQIAENWGEWKGLAAFYLIMATLRLNKPE